MFKPNYRITEYFLSLIEQITIFKTKIEDTNIEISLMVQLQNEALERNTHSSTYIEGNVLSLAQVSALNHNKDISSELKYKKEVLNYFKALRWIIKNSKKNINIGNLLNIHKIVVNELLQENKIGKIRVKQNFVIDDRKKIVFTPPKPKDCKKLLIELLEWINLSKNIHPIILSAIFHHQFVTIHPFSDGNGRVARVAAQWILYQKDFDHNHILSIDEFYALKRQEYYNKIQQVRDLDYDFTFWIEYVALGLLDTLKRTYSRINKLSLYNYDKIIITPKQEELLNILTMNGSLGSIDLCKFLNINRARVNQLISPLIKSGIINKNGKARATRYFIRK